MASKYGFWVVFAGFVACAMYLDRSQLGFTGEGPLGGGRVLVWMALLGFLGYTIYCSARENLFKSIARMATLHWGRQVGIDLYLGLSLMLFVVYLNERSVLVVLLWLLPTLLFANLATLLYFAIHYDQIVSKLLS